MPEVDFEDVGSVRNHLRGMESQLTQEFNRLDKTVESLKPSTTNKGFLDTYGSRPWPAAGAAAGKGVVELKNGALQVMKGDTVGGTAAIFNGIGSISGVMALAGPVGSIMAGVMSIFTSIISAILNVLMPPTRSLEEKIQGMLTDQTLSNQFSNVKGAYSSWNTIQAEISNEVALREKAARLLEDNLKETDPSKKLPEEILKAQKLIADGWSWERLTTYSNWRTHQQTIFTTFSLLTKEQGRHSKEWMPLYNLTIQYALNFWVGFTSMGALVDEGSHSTYGVSRASLAQELRAALRAGQFASLNEGALWAMHYSGNFASDNGSAYNGSTHDNLIQFDGVFDKGAVNVQDNLGGQVYSFAVSSGGTIFSGGKTDNSLKPKLCVGRGKCDETPVWVVKPGAPECQQVVIGERHNGIIKVLALHASGSKITVHDFDDRLGRTFESSPATWTPHDERWGTATTYDVPNARNIASMAVDPRSLVDGEKLAIYAFALMADGGVCYRYQFDEECRTLHIAETYNDTWMTTAAFEQATFDRRALLWQGNICPCTVSCTWHTILVQVGNIAWVYERSGNTTWRKWESLPDFFGKPELIFHQAYVYDDNAYVGMTNMGLHMRYWDLEKNCPAYASENKLQSLRFIRHPSQQAGVMLNLLGAMEKEASNAN